MNPFDYDQEPDRLTDHELEDIEESRISIAEQKNDEKNETI